MQFHERLKEYRKKCGLTQEELARKIHISRSAVAKWENGLGLPAEDSLDALAAFFEVDREELLADRETESIIVAKNGKLSRQKLWLICLIVLVGVILVVSAIVLGVFLPRGNSLPDDQGNSIEDPEEIPVAGIDKNDKYTWFEINKKNLPDLAACQEITQGMSLNQVINKLGKPQREVGYGAILLQFDLADGKILTITFVEDSAKMQTKPNLTTYDYLIVYYLDFDRGIPDKYFPYCGALNELYPWIDKLKVEEIAKVRFEHAFVGVAPGHLKDISYSTNRADVANAYRLLFSNLTAISPQQGQVSGGGYVKYDFFTGSGETYSITVHNNTVFINNQYYKFVDNYYYAFQKPDLNCNSFITYAPYYDDYEIFTYANESDKVGEFSGLGEFEFCIYDGLVEHTPHYYLRSDAVNLLILSKDQFMIEHDNNTIVYQLTGKKDFSALFPKSTD